MMGVAWVIVALRVCVCVCDRAREREMTDVCVRARVVFGDESAVGAAESARAKGETG